MRVVSQGWWYGSSKTLGYSVGVSSVKETNKNIIVLVQSKMNGVPRPHILKH